MSKKGWENTLPALFCFLIEELLAAKAGVLREWAAKRVFLS